MPNSKNQWPCDKCGQLLEWGKTAKGFRPVLVSDPTQQHLTNYCKGNVVQTSQTSQRTFADNPAPNETPTIPPANNTGKQGLQDVASQVNYIAEFCRRMENMKLAETRNANSDNIDNNYRQLITKMAETIADMTNTLELVAMKLDVPLPGREPKPVK